MYFKRITKNIEIVWLKNKNKNTFKCSLGITLSQTCCIFSDPYMFIFCSICMFLCQLVTHSPLFSFYFHIYLLHAFTTCHYSFSHHLTHSVSCCFFHPLAPQSYPPNWNLKHYCQWSNPPLESLKKPPGWQKETNPGKMQQILPQVCWG